MLMQVGTCYSCTRCRAMLTLACTACTDRSLSCRRSGKFHLRQQDWCIPKHTNNRIHKMFLSTSLHFHMEMEGMCLLEQSMWIPYNREGSCMSKHLWNCLCKNLFRVDCKGHWCTSLPGQCSWQHDSKDGLARATQRRSRLLLLQQ